MKSKRNKSGLIATLALTAVLGTSAYAFTATNTVSPSRAGSGGAANNISGYDASSVSYSVVGGSITSVSFTLDNAAGNAVATINGTAGDCVITGGTAAVCSANAPAANFGTLQAATELDVAAWE